MGIGNTVKEMFKPDPSSVTEGEAGNANVSGNPLRTEERVGSRTYEPDALGEPTRTTDSNRGSRKLPSGTGIGTSGKSTMSHQIAMEQDVERAKTQGIAGYGTDAAAAAGGSLSGTHQGARTTGLSQSSGLTRNTRIGPTSSTSAESLDARASEGRYSTAESSRPLGEFSEQDPTASQVATEFSGQPPMSGHAGVLDPHHDAGHRKRDVMPSGDTEEDTNQLNPVTHEHIRHLETEDVERLKSHERHIHHVQHHTQPVILTQHLPETHRDQIHPVTRVQERHVNKVEDNELFEKQVLQHRNTTEHGAKERTIIDKGTAVTEKIYHHIHHVIQPVIEKEIVNRQFTHTKIPIVEVTNEAPIVHQTQTHAPIPFEHFVDRGGAVSGAVPQEEISKKVLHGGECTREVEGVAGDLERELNLDSTQVHRREEPQYITTKVTKRTTVIEDPNLAAQAPAPRN